MNGSSGARGFRRAFALPLLGGFVGLLLTVLSGGPRTSSAPAWVGWHARVPAVESATSLAAALDIVRDVAPIAGPQRRSAPMESGALAHGAVVLAHAPAASAAPEFRRHAPVAIAAARGYDATAPPHLQR